MEESTSKWTGLVIAVALLLGLGYIVGTGQIGTKQPEQTTDIVAEPVSPTVVSSFNYQGEDGKTVYELLQVGHTVEAQESEAGVLVTKIDGVGGDTDTFWIYYVNGEMGTMAADKTMTQTGQTIEWRYEKY